jgi:hypothetical protein
VWSGITLDIRQEPIEEEVFDLSSLDLRVQRLTNQPCSSSWHTDCETVWGLGTEGRFLDVTAHAYQRVPLTRRQFARSRGGKPRFEGMRQGEVEIVATEDYVITDGDAMQLELAVLRIMCA